MMEANQQERKEKKMHADEDVNQKKERGVGDEQEQQNNRGTVKNWEKKRRVEMGERISASWILCFLSLSCEKLRKNATRESFLPHTINKRLCELSLNAVSVSFAFFTRFFLSYRWLGWVTARAPLLPR